MTVSKAQLSVLASTSRSPPVAGSASSRALRSPRVTTSTAPANPIRSPATFRAPNLSLSSRAARIADQSGMSPMSQPVFTALVRVSA
jgi:hypothetical protein